MEKEKNVYQNIEESPFSYKYEDYEFYFSSQFYRRNFKKRLPLYLKEETFKIKNKYKIINEEFVLIFFKEILLIALYKKIEKRGFKILKSGERLVDN